MLRIVCAAVLLLGVTGCTGGEAARNAAAPAPTAVPTLGACRSLAPQDVGSSVNAAPAVDCATPHTAQTFAVGGFPKAVAAKGTGSRALGRYVYDRCQTRFERFVGANDSLLLRSTLSWAWFRPTQAAWDQGAHTWRCDVVGGDEKSTALLPLPRSAQGLLLGHPDDRWLSCVDAPTVSGSPKIACSKPHTWRAVTTIVLGQARDPYPGDRLSQVRTRDYCSDSVGAWLNYPVDYDYGYTWFHEAEWDAGNRRSVCWAKTVQ